MSEDYLNHSAGVVTAPHGGSLESPSLFRPGTPDPGAPLAYEMKFLLSEELAQEVDARVRRFLTLDPHADPALNGAYRTTSLYTETAQFDVFRRVGEYGRSKLRIRRYGNTGPVFLERKDKDGDRVRKCRGPVLLQELGLMATTTPPNGWSGGWFHQQVTARQLAPVCRIGYERVAYLGAADGGAVRVTFDREVRGETADRWDATMTEPGPVLLPGLVICEFKFRLAMPVVFKEVVEELGLSPTTVSKYRRFVQAAGLAPSTREADAGRAPDA